LGEVKGEKGESDGRTDRHLIVLHAGLARPRGASGEGGGEREGREGGEREVSE
jgi:hypothetical protein